MRQGRCSPASCACVLLALLLVALATTAGVYFGVQFLDDNGSKRGDRVYKGSFAVGEGDSYAGSLADALSEPFQEKADAYKARLDQVYRKSPYKGVFLQSEVLAFNRRGNKQLVVHFNLHLSGESQGVSAADLYVVLSEEAKKFKGIRIDQDSIHIQERKLSSDDDHWLPRRQYPGYIEGLSTPQPSVVPRKCSPVEVAFCQDALPHNMTAYPNLVGHQDLPTLQADLVSFRQILDFECYPLAREFVCHLLQPDCDLLLTPCKGFCEDFWQACRDLLPEKVRRKIDCSKFPDFSGKGTCARKPGCGSELRALGMSDLLCDGVVDCADLSDETSSCDYCREGQFLCGGGDRQCVDHDRRCDLREDCRNGADERNCVTVGRSGLLLFTDSGTTSRVCADNLNASLSPSRRHAVLQGLAAATCRDLRFGGAESFEVRRDDAETVGEYVQLVDPFASNVAFAPAVCDERNVVHVSCGPSECGVTSAPSGSQSLPGQWPWHAALFKNGEYACDATLVSDDRLLTSTSCLNSDSDYTVRLGIVRLGSRIRPIRPIRSVRFDQEARVVGRVQSELLTVLRIEPAVNGSDFVRPACLPTRNSTWTACRTLRWSGKKRHLSEVRLEVARCRDEDSSSSMCADDDGECGEGSPLLCPRNDKWYLIGVSSGKKCRFEPTFEHLKWT